MPVVKTRPNMPDFEECYTGVTDDSLERIKASVRQIPQEALAHGIGTSGVFGSVNATMEDDEEYGDDTSDFEFSSEDEQRLAATLSQEEPEAELHAGASSHYLYPDFGAIMSLNRHTGSINIETFEYEEEMYNSWDEKMLASRRREY